MSGWDTTGSIATAAHGRIDSIDSSTSGNMVNFASGALIDLQNVLSTTINTPIAEKYQNILINMTALYALSRMAGVGVDFNFSVGEISVSKGAKATPETTQMEFLASQVNNGIQGIGRTMRWGKTV